VKKVLLVPVVALVACLAAAVVVGGASRLLMRAINVAAGAESGFSWGGTIAIVVAFAAFMLPGALVAAATRRRGRTVLLVLGALALCVPAVSIAGEELGSTDGFTTVRWAAVLAAGAGVFATIAAMPVVTLRVVDRLRPR
jgi:hypothetical protein